MIFFTTIFANAQLPNIAGIKVSRGFIMPHHQEIRSLLKKHITQFNLQLGWQTAGNKDWQRAWNYPEIGTGFYYANLGNPEILGDAKAMYLYYNTPLIRQKMFNLSFYLALGTAYLQKPFNYQTNYNNIVIGSHFNIFANTNIEAQLRTKRIIFYSDFGLTHYSNGGTKMPNLGINVVALSLGIKYKTVDISRKRNMVQNRIKKYDELMFVQTFSKHADNVSVSNPQFFVTSLSIDYGRYFSAKGRVGGGLDFMYDQAANNLSAGDSTIVMKNIYFYPAGVHIGYDAVIGDFRFSFQNIFFIYKKYGGRMFQRYGLKYMAGKHLVFNLTLLTEFFSAYTIEPGIGYRILIDN